MAMRASPGAGTHLSPHEIMTGRVMPGPPREGGHMPALDVQQIVMSDYVKKLKVLSAALSTQVHKVQEGELPGDTPTLKVKVGDWVRVKVHKRKWLEPRWTGPYETVLEWRSRLSLTRTSTGLQLIIRAQPSKGCQDFWVAPYVGSTEIKVFWKVQICSVEKGQPTAITVGDDISKTVSVAQGTGVWGPVTMISTPTSRDDTIHTTTGISGCVVCMGARPLLRIVPAVLTDDCLLPLMNKDNPPANCSQWDTVYPVVSDIAKKPKFSSKVAKANFTCINMTGGGRSLGQLPASWCTHTHVITSSFKPVSRADVWWWCGGTELFDGLPRYTTGVCTLVNLLLPISVYPIGVQDLLTRIQALGPEIWPTRTKRMVGPSAGDPTYIDAIGVPRGVPDEYKLIDQVAAGFESSICWWCTINKNVDRINYIHFNVQKLGNWTQGFEAVHGQLAATSLMAFQNRIAVDMLLAERGGVCAMFGEQCCTFIPNNTATDGSLTVALEGLRTLNGKMKHHSGVDTSMWDSWMDAFGNYKTLISSVLVSVAVFVAILTLCGCCCIPCARTLATRVITTAITPLPSNQTHMYPLLTVDDPDEAFPPFQEPPLPDYSSWPLQV
uniref:Murine leukemia virus integrase C-terminal domain-containing protein n=1 Tax=Oncorhynchus mykiss TaxID=8022 RepID=A0A8C7UJW7_ONCMY